jgi:coproporphyrinogen III oxidase
MSVMRGGRVFEKVGVNVSTVYGTARRTAQKAMAARGVPGMEGRPALLGLRHQPGGAYAEPAHAGGAHEHPDVLDAHRLVVRRRLRPQPLHRIRRGHRAFPRRPQGRLRPHDPTTTRFKAWADEYFYVPHRGRARGVGGIFYDDLNTGDWEADFAFTQDVGRAFLPAFVPSGEAPGDTPWTEADRRRSWSTAGSMPSTTWSTTAAPSSGWRPGTTRMPC